MNQIRSMQRHHHRFRTVGEGAISVSFQKAIEYFGGTYGCSTAPKYRIELNDQPG